MITQDQLKDVVERTESLYRYLEIDKKKTFAPKLPISGTTRNAPRNR